MVLVDIAAASHSHYSIHTRRDTSQSFRGFKYRLTSCISAGGHYGPTWVQYLDLPVGAINREKAPLGLVVQPILGLAPDGNVNPLSRTVGYIVLMEKGQGVETECFRLYEELARKPFIDTLRRNREPQLKSTNW